MAIIQKCVVIRDDQHEFLQNQRQMFNLSKFVRAKLDDYIKLMKDYKEFTEVEDEKKIE